MNYNSDNKSFFSSGIRSLDLMLQGILAGDNVVWQVDNIKDYFQIVEPFCRHAYKEGKRLIYFRFAEHASLLPENVEAQVYNLDPRAGFEQFISDIFNVIEKFGKGACYVFDCLSGLAVDWYSDRMLGNFFMLTCPYLYDFETATYFVLFRNQHTPFAIKAIHSTAQVVVDVFGSGEKIYLLPLKVFKRYSPTMYMLHSWEGDVLRPVKRSATVSEIMSEVPQPWIDGNINPQDTWTSTFIRAQDIQKKMEKTGGERREEVNSLKEQLIKMIITRDDELLRLCEKYFDISDLISIGKRMIGTGLIGGKSAGMLLSRAILKKTNPKWNDLLETHDSFFLGSDVFYTYVIQNKCWWEKHNLKYSDKVFDDAGSIREKLEKGKFPRDIIEQLKEMLSYFGQSPFIVRSSSLLEDAYGNAFSGKYESVFCANQGTPEERIENLLSAVRKVYASTMSEDALSYRIHRKILEREEQMALLIQRVSGSFYGDLYFPQIAGVGYSFNPFVWNSKIDPAKGVIRLVFGLGTRAVDRRDEDYTRIVALNAPLVRPESSFDDVKRYAQKVVDVINLSENSLTSCDFEEVAKKSPEIPIEIFATKVREMELRAREYNIADVFPWMISFEKLLTKTSFVENLSQMMKEIEKAYNHPVDIEFAANFLNEEDYRINLLQCRPFQVIGEIKEIKSPDNISKDNMVLRTGGPIIGQTALRKIDKIIFVLPEKYGDMPISEKYSVARLIGKLTNMKNKNENIMLIGPGRWGTKMPSLGVPVSFSEIKNVAVLCELAMMRKDLTPDISLGTHFFNDLVEMEIIYLAVFPEKEGYFLNDRMLKTARNKLKKLTSVSGPAADAVHVIDTAELKKGSAAFIHVDALKQEGMVFLSAEAKNK
ncbi:MAG: PEP/pyruvate-binding domain-containing protein [bacterium]|nr:PEP/pyruvate-binding domain-containing protein [bacterium]